MFHRLKSTLHKYQSDRWRVKGLTGVEQWPMQTSDCGPSPLWLKKAFEMAERDAKGENVSQIFPTALFCGSHHGKRGLPPPFLVGWPEPLMTPFLLRLTTLTSSWLTKTLKCLSSNPAVDLGEKSLKSCLKQVEFDRPPSSLQKLFSWQVNWVPEIMVINAVTICMCVADSLADQLHLLLLNNHFLELLSVLCCLKV